MKSRIYVYIFAFTLNFALSSVGVHANTGCDQSVYQANKTKVKALQQQQTEAAKALITKPASVQQLTCFDQYAKVNADQIGKIHSKPSTGISDTIAPNVELPNMQNVIQNFMTGVLSGGLQSMLNGVMGQLSGALGGLTGGLTGGAGGSNCNAMGEMWNIMQCIDFPDMPSLSDIMGGGGGGGDLGGILSGLGGAGGLGSLGQGGGGGGIMGAVCQAMKGAMGGGGSGSTSAYEDALAELQKGGENNSDLYDSDYLDDMKKTIEDVTSGENTCTANTWKYPTAELARIDVMNKNQTIEVNEFTLFDLDGDCEITTTEIEAYESTISASNSSNP